MLVEKIFFKFEGYTTKSYQLRLPFMYPLQVGAPHAQLKASYI